MMGDHMKKTFIGGATLAALALSVPAMAADLPVKAPVYKAPVEVPYDWSGFYVGLNGGYSWGRSATDFSVAGVTVLSTTQDLRGWVFGGQAGYNWQFNRNWLFGLEADIQATGQRGSFNFPTGTVGPICPGPAAVALPCTTTVTTGTFEQKLPWFGTARARLGVLPGDRVLLYVTGGLAFGEVETDATATSTTTTAFLPNGPVVGTTVTNATASANTTRGGWTVGGGAEWVISGPWTAKVEYLHIDLGTITNTFAAFGGFGTVTASSHVTDDIVRVGLNYRFGGPVVAKY
jgi:outer membrane immunogenic protein